jgi:peptide deformylase
MQNKEQVLEVPDVVVDPKILRQPSKPTTEKECAKKGLFKLLPAAMQTAWVGGVAISAIQIGIPLQICYYKIGEKEGFLINLKVLKGGGHSPRLKEGCLSIPGQRFTTYRYDHIKYSCLFKGETREFEARDFFAHVIQHEYDHMLGLLCCDRSKRMVEPGRNEPCPCGSGKKYKKCCLDEGLDYALTDSEIFKSLT